MTYQKLKNCPWCGRPTKLIEAGGFYYVTCGDELIWNYTCDRVTVVYYESAEKAIEGWNKNEVVRAKK